MRDDGIKERSRNLAQYKNLSDDEFDISWEKSKRVAVSVDDSMAIFEAKIKERLELFSEDYDLSDMKINDKMTLRALIQAILTLEDYEQRMFRYREDSDGFDNITNVKKLNDMMQTLRKDISSLQQDLNITRKTRKSDKDMSVVAFIDDLKDKAKRTYDAKMKYIFCTKCNMLLGTVWSQYEDKGKFDFICQRSLNDNKICGTRVTVTLEQLRKLGGSNVPEVLPDGIK